MQIKKILWASDGSEESLEALKWVVIFATRYGAKITALNVIESPNISPLKVSNDLKRDISPIDSVMGETEARRLDGVHKVLRKKGIKVEARVARGAPPPEIANAAQSHAVDLIAMGKRGLTPGGRMLLGSTTATVLRKAHVPIMAVRPTARRLAVKKKSFFPPVFFPKTKGVPRFFLGSLAEAVIEEAPCPVIAVPPSFHSPAQFYIEPSIEGKFKERSPQVVSLPCDQDNAAGPAG